MKNWVVTAIADDKKLRAISIGLIISAAALLTLIVYTSLSLL